VSVVVARLAMLKLLAVWNVAPAVSTGGVPQNSVPVYLHRHQKKKKKKDKKKKTTADYSFQGETTKRDSTYGPVSPISRSSKNSRW
jgi:hypothetical protein